MPSDIPADKLLVHFSMYGEIEEGSLGFDKQTGKSKGFGDAESAGVVHFNGRAKPWLEIAFPQLRKLWTKYVDFSDKFIKSCHIRAS